MPLMPLYPRYASRNCCAAPPFSTHSPSGESYGPPDPLASKYQKPPVPAGVAVVGASGGALTSFLVQKLMASGWAKPDEPAAGWSAESTRNRLPTSFTANLYCLRLPSQRGRPPPSGRNTPIY